jgi:hypothetical protein
MPRGAARVGEGAPRPQEEVYRAAVTPVRPRGGSATPAPDRAAPARAVPRVAAWGPAVGRLSARALGHAARRGRRRPGVSRPGVAGDCRGELGGALRLPGIGRRIGWLGGLRSRVQEKWRRAAAAISLAKSPGRPTEWSLFPVGQSCGGARTRPARVREADRFMGRFRAEHGLSWSGVFGFSTNSSARNRAVGRNFRTRSGPFRGDYVGPEPKAVTPSVRIRAGGPLWGRSLPRPAPVVLTYLRQVGVHHQKSSMLRARKVELTIS